MIYFSSAPYRSTASCSAERSSRVLSTRSRERGRIHFAAFFRVSCATLLCGCLFHPARCWCCCFPHCCWSVRVREFSSCVSIRPTERGYFFLQSAFPWSFPPQFLLDAHPHHVHVCTCSSCCCSILETKPKRRHRSTESHVSLLTVQGNGNWITII